MGRGTSGTPTPSMDRMTSRTSTARGTFDVTMSTGPAELDGNVSRFELSKTFHGDLRGVGAGVMLSGGDPPAGTAGYVAIETVHGHLGDRQGGFALQQFGTMRGGSQTLHYDVVPGSGNGELDGITAPSTSTSTRTAPTATPSSTTCDFRTSSRSPENRLSRRGRAGS